MKYLSIFLSYALMLTFDAALIGGTVYLIVQHNWSAWWLLAVALILDGSSPKKLFESA
jgi:hypothetical protein